MKQQDFDLYLELEELFLQDQISFDEFLCEYTKITAFKTIKKIKPYKMQQWRSKREDVLKNQCQICGCKQQLTIQHTFQPPTFIMCKELLSKGRIKSVQPKKAFWVNQLNGNRMGLKGTRKKKNLGVCKLIFEDNHTILTHEETLSEIKKLHREIPDEKQISNSKKMTKKCPKCRKSLPDHWYSPESGIWTCIHPQYRKKYGFVPDCGERFKTPVIEMVSVQTTTTSTYQDKDRKAREIYEQSILGELDEKALKIWIKYQKEYRSLKPGQFITACGECAFKQDEPYQKKREKKKSSVLLKRIIRRRTNESNDN